LKKEILENRKDNDNSNSYALECVFVKIEEAMKDLKI